MKQHQHTPQGNKLKSGSRKRPSVATMALVNAIMLTGAANAQTNTPPVTAGVSTNAPTKLPDVVITGEKAKDEGSYKPEMLSSPKYTVPLRDVPQIITVIPKAVMAEQGATTLRDVLRNVPGISIQAGEGGVPAGDNLSIRGFSARTDMFIDGVRDFGGYSRDPFNLEQVEVAKGPSSSNAGRGSTGGSINLVSKMPQLDAFYAGSAGYGTDDYKRTTLDLNQPLKDVGIEGTALRFNALWHDANTPGRDVVGDSRWGLAPSLAFGLGTPTRLTLSYFHLDQDNIPDYGIPWVPNTNVPLGAFGDQPAPVDYSNFYGLESRDYERTRTDLGTALLEHDFNDEVSLRNLFRMGLTTRDSVITAPRFLNTTSTTINRQIQSRDQVDTVLANQTDLTTRFEIDQLEHTMVSGLEFAAERSENYLRTGTTSTTDLFNPGTGDPNPGAVTRTGAVNKADALTVSLYAFDTVKLGEQWEWSGGLRFDHFEVEYNSRSAANVLTTLRSGDDMVSWRTGLVFKPRENGSIYFGYGTSFNPSAEGLTLASGATSANSINTDPEQSQTFELGTKWDFFKQRLSLSAAIFRTDKTNARTEDPTDPADIIVLDGVQRVQGIELGAAGRITDDWQVFAGYAFMHSEIVESKNAAEAGNQLSNTPQQSFNLWTTYKLPWNLEIGGGAQFVDSRFSSNANTRSAPSYLLFDAMVGYQITKNIDLRLNIYNLADEEYIDRVGGGHFVPGAGRSAVLSANFKF